MKARPALGETQGNRAPDAAACARNRRASAIETERMEILLQKVLRVNESLPVRCSVRCLRHVRNDGDILKQHLLIFRSDHFVPGCVLDRDWIATQLPSVAIRRV